MKKMSEKLNQIKWHSSRKIYIYIKHHSPALAMLLSQVPGIENNVTETMAYGYGEDHLLSVSFQSLCKGICHCQIYEYACFG